MFVSTTAGTWTCGFTVVSCVARGLWLHSWTPPSSLTPVSSLAPTSKGTVSTSRLAKHSSVLSWQHMGIWKQGLVHEAKPAFVPPFSLPHHWLRQTRHDKDMSTSWCPRGTQQIPVWLGLAVCPSFTPFQRGHVQMWQQAGASCRISPNAIPLREGLNCFSLAFGSIFHPHHAHGCQVERSSCLAAASMPLHGNSWAL